jgi:hypothetical protein
MEWGYSLASCILDIDHCRYLVNIIMIFWFKEKRNFWVYVQLCAVGDFFNKVKGKNLSFCYEIGMFPSGSLYKHVVLCPNLIAFQR